MTTPPNHLVVKSPAMPNLKVLDTVSINCVSISVQHHRVLQAIDDFLHFLLVGKVDVPAHRFFLLDDRRPRVASHF